DIYVPILFVGWVVSLMFVVAFKELVCNFGMICIINGLEPWASIAVIVMMVVVSMAFNYAIYRLYLGRMVDIGRSESLPRFWRWMFSTTVRQRLDAYFAPSVEPKLSE